MNISAVPSNSTFATRPTVIQVASCSASELFKESVPDTAIGGRLVIPEYQRPYVWGEKQISTLLNDLEHYFSALNEDTPMYYMGSVILHQTEDRLNIIDGQQRITTLAIIQSILDQNKVPAIHYASPLTIRNIKQNHQWFKERLNGKSKIDFSRINFTLVVTPDEDDAYTFFETQNTGGVRLSGSDILKAFHLRSIAEEYRRSRFAEQWEEQAHVDEVIQYLLKARYWNILDFKEVPSHRDIRSTKNQIISEFSERTSGAKKNTAFQIVEINTDEQQSFFSVPTFAYSARQPLNNGVNFISYLTAFSKLHHDLFVEFKPFFEKEYYIFYETIVKRIDGTAYLKEFFEIGLMVYCSRFGFKHLYEASLWIFRYTYSLRVSNQKTVREDSIPAFVKRNNYLFDQIISGFTHDETMSRLMNFTYEVDERNMSGNTVKSRFSNRVQEYFGFELQEQEIKEKYDLSLKNAINEKVRKNHEKI